MYRYALSHVLTRQNAALTNDYVRFREELQSRKDLQTPHAASTDIFRYSFERIVAL